MSGRVSEQVTKLMMNSARTKSRNHSHRIEPPEGPFSRVWYLLIKTTCAVIFHGLFRLRVRGTEQVPSTGATLVLANHASHLDPVLVGVGCPRQLRYLARDSLFFWPLGWLIHSLGAVPIDRRSGIAGLRATLQILKQHDALLLFPEGTRSHDGQQQPLKPGFCSVARRSQAALLPVGIAGSFAALPRGRNWPRLTPIALAFERPIPFSEYGDLSDDELINLVSARLAEAVDAAGRLSAGHSSERAEGQAE
jgi:1-acyl-sn-glycerol-3-phosphate acyltransferase